MNDLDPFGVVVDNRFQKSGIVFSKEPRTVGLSTKQFVGVSQRLLYLGFDPNVNEILGSRGKDIGRRSNNGAFTFSLQK